MACNAFSNLLQAHNEEEKKFADEKLKLRIEIRALRGKVYVSAFAVFIVRFNFILRLVDCSRFRSR